MSDRKNTVKAYNKEDMCEEVKHYLETEHNVHWIKDEAVCRIVHFVYHGGIWDEDYRSRFPALKRKHHNYMLWQAFLPLPQREYQARQSHTCHAHFRAPHL